MEGPFDPQQPAPDAGAPQAAGQDDDLHALLERLLGQGDVGQGGAGSDDLWPDLFPAAADEVSTIVPPPEAPLAEPAAAVEAAPVAAETAADAPARAWEPVVVDSGASTNVDDIHAAILASVSMELEPIAPAVEPPAVAEARIDVDPAASHPSASVLPAIEEPAVEEPTLPVTADLLLADALAGETVVHAPVFDHVPVEGASADLAAATLPPAEEATIDLAPMADPEPAAADAFALTPFETSAEPLAEADLDAEALWAAAVPELEIDIAPQLDLDGDTDDEAAPAAPTAVVLPWPSQEPKAAEPAPAARDLIEAALATVTADLTTEPVEPLRTPDVAASTAHVVFRLGARVMAVPLAAVSEIARPPKYTRLPHVPAWVLGIANLRGDIVSILDLEGFFSGKVGRSSHEQRMLALRPAGDEVRTAVLVDSVDGIQGFEDARIARVTRGYDAEVAPYARGLYQLEQDLVVVLDADRLLQSKPMRQFEDGAGAR